MDLTAKGDSILAERQEHTTSVYKNEKLTKEIYTQIWIELISKMEQRKNIKTSANI